MNRSRSATSRAPGWWRLLAALCALALVAAACGDDAATGDTTTTTAATGDDGGEEAPPPDEGEPVYGGEAVMAIESETNSYSPDIFAGTAAGYNAALAVFDPLVRTSEDGEIVPYLAESVEANDDATEWTVTLREGVLFHDGTELTAEVQKTAFDEYLIAEGSRRLGDLAQVSEVRVDDPYQYTYVLVEGNAAFADLLLGPIGWPFSVEAAAAAGEDFGEAPVGTGPFVFSSWQRDDAFVAVRNESYWQDGLPYLDRVTFRVIPDEDVRVAAIQTGDIDATHSVRLSGMLGQMRSLADAGTVVMYEYPGNTGSGSIINVERPPLDDVRVRRALIHALDSDALISVIAGEGATPRREAYFDPSSQWYSQAAADAYPDYDPERATELLDEYINDPARSDGKAVGAPVSFQFNCTAIGSLQEQAQAYQAYWAQVGVEVTLNALEQSIHIQNAIEGTFDINCWRQGSDADPYTSLSAAHGPVETTPGNFTNYTSDVILDALARMKGSTDLDERYAAVEAIQLEINENAVIIWTGGNNEFIAAKPNILGIDSWTTPEGVVGDGASAGITLWGQVWNTGS